MGLFVVYRIQKLLSRLRKAQPALFVLPGLLFAQCLASQLSAKTLLLASLILVLALIKSKKYLAFTTGLCLGFISTLTLQRQASLTLQAIALGRIESFRFPKPGLQQFSFSLLQTEDTRLISNNLIGKKFSCKAVSLPWKNISEVEVGDLIAIKANFTTFGRNLWPWEYDSTMARRGLSGSCKVIYAAKIGNSKIGLLTQFRNSLLSKYGSIVGTDEIASMLLSLSLGVRDLISTSTERSFKDLGISHVLVLSGMQIGLIFFGSAFLIRNILRRLIRSNPALNYLLVNVLAAALSGLLVCLTSFEASAVRSWIACCILAIANSSEREGGLVRGSFASFLLLSLLWPGCWMEAGVQLSFAALFGIALGQQAAETTRQRLILPCLFATLFTAIVSAIWFKVLSPAAFLANFVLAPWFGVIGCYLGFLLVIACYFDIPGVDEFAMLARWLTSLALVVVQKAHAILPTSYDLSSTEISILAGTLALFVCFLLLRRTRLWIREYNLI